MQWDKLAALRQRQLTGARAQEFLEWLSQLEAELRETTWEMLSGRKLEASDLHDVNSVAVTLRSLKDFLKSRADDGMIAGMEEDVENGSGADDGTD